jgi:hypothetical protein
MEQNQQAIGLVPSIESSSAMPDDYALNSRDMWNLEPQEEHSNGRGVFGAFIIAGFLPEIKPRKACGGFYRFSCSAVHAVTMGVKKMLPMGI